MIVVGENFRVTRESCPSATHLGTKALVKGSGRRPTGTFCHTDLVELRADGGQLFAMDRC